MFVQKFRISKDLNESFFKSLQRDPVRFSMITIFYGGGN